MTAWTRATRADQETAWQLHQAHGTYNHVGRIMGLDRTRVARMVQRREREKQITSALNSGLVERRLVPLWTKAGTVRSVAVVDAADFEVTENWRWHVTGDKYAAHWEYEPEKHLVMLHRFLMDPADHLEVDHIDWDGFNNRRSNLRIVTRAQNAQNQRVQRDNTSGIRGVRWKSATGKWIVRLELAFDDKDEAEIVNQELRTRYMPYSQEALQNGV